MFALSPFAFPSISVPTGGGGSSNFSDLPYETLNINSGWTLPTKSGYQISTATYDANGVGSYTVLGSPANTFPDMPLAYRQAYAFDASANKTLLTNTDNFRLDIRLSSFQSGASVYGNSIGFGIANDPLSSVWYEFGLCVLSVVKPGNGTVIPETVEPLSASQYGSTQSRSQYGSILVQSGRIIQVNGVALNASGAMQASNSITCRQSGIRPTYTGPGYTLNTGPVNLIFFVFPNSGTNTGQSTGIKVEFRAIKYEDLTP